MSHLHGAFHAGEETQFGHLWKVGTRERPGRGTRSFFNHNKPFNQNCCFAKSYNYNYKLIV